MSDGSALSRSMSCSRSSDALRRFSPVSWTSMVIVFDLRERSSIILVVLAAVSASFIFSSSDLTRAIVSFASRTVSRASLSIWSALPSPTIFASLFAESERVWVMFSRFVMILVIFCPAKKVLTLLVADTSSSDMALKSTSFGFLHHVVDAGHDLLYLRRIGGDDGIVGFKGDLRCFGEVPFFAVVQLDIDYPCYSRRLQLGCRCVGRIATEIDLHDDLDEAIIWRDADLFHHADLDAPVLDARVDLEPLNGFIKIGDELLAFLEVLRGAEPDDGTYRYQGTCKHEKTYQEIGLLLCHVFIPSFSSPLPAG